MAGRQEAAGLLMKLLELYRRRLKNAETLEGEVVPLDPMTMKETPRCDSTS